ERDGSFGPHGEGRVDSAWAVSFDCIAGAAVREEVTAALHCAFLRDIFGNPFRPAVVSSAWLAWNSGTIPRLAQAAYLERELPGGPLDRTRLAVLADALEESGCYDPGILEHLRGSGPCVRGCAVVDALRGQRPGWLMARRSCTRLTAYPTMKPRLITVPKESTTSQV